MLTFGSLFSGIGGFDLGLERAGMVCKWQVEIDEYCNKVLEKHWPDVQRYRDIRECGAHNLEPVDLICGGFPCQDVSLAGKRAGLEGERSGLWSEYRRIIRELRPEYVLVENVPGLLSKGMGTVLGDLAASGYDAEWESLLAAAFGAPHIRERVFIIAHAQGDIRGASWNEERKAFDGSNSILANSNKFLLEGFRTSGEQVLVSRHSKAELKSFCERAAVQWATEPDVGRVANGIPSRMDRLRCLGNAVVPQVAEWIGKQIMEYAGWEL